MSSSSTATPTRLRRPPRTFPRRRLTGGRSTQPCPMDPPIGDGPACSSSSSAPTPGGSRRGRSRTAAKKRSSATCSSTRSSFSMVRLGWEPLHATAVLTGHGVVAFIAESGGGKSTHRRIARARRLPARDRRHARAHRERRTGSEPSRGRRASSCIATSPSGSSVLTGTA